MANYTNAWQKQLNAQKEAEQRAKEESQSKSFKTIDDSHRFEREDSLYEMSTPSQADTDCNKYVVVPIPENTENGNLVILKKRLMTLIDKGQSKEGKNFAFKYSLPDTRTDAFTQEELALMTKSNRTEEEERIVNLIKSYDKLKARYKAIRKDKEAADLFAFGKERNWSNTIPNETLSGFFGIWRKWTRWDGQKGGMDCKTNKNDNSVKFIYSIKNKFGDILESAINSFGKESLELGDEDWVDQYMTPYGGIKGYIDINLGNFGQQSKTQTTIQIKACEGGRADKVNNMDPVPKESDIKFPKYKLDALRWFFKRPDGEPLMHENLLAEFENALLKKELHVEECLGYNTNPFAGQESGDSKETTGVKEEIKKPSKPAAAASDDDDKPWD